MNKSTQDYELHSTTPQYLELVRKHTKSYIYDLNGENILIYPGVMSPKYDWAGHFMIEKLPAVKGKKVLEIGSGCGLVSMACYRKGAKELLAVDINKKAVENTKKNFQRIGAGKNFTAIYSDVYEQVDGKYDVIIFNAPYHGCSAKDDLEKGVADENYQALKTFFAESNKYLEPDGLLAVGFSSSGDHELFDELVRKENLTVKQEYSDIRDRYQCEVFILTWK